MAVGKGATSLVEMILKKFADDTAGAAKELERLGGFPESVSQRIASGELPMDEASRVARRDAQTDGNTYYHGAEVGGFNTVDPQFVGATNSNSKGTGLWASSEPDVANSFVADIAEMRPDGVIQPLMYKGSNPRTVEANGDGFSEIYVEDHGLMDTDSIARAAKRDGHDSAIINDVVDFGPYAEAEFPKAQDPSTIISMFDGNKVRSPNAAFDPQYKGSNMMGNADPRLLGGLAAGTAGLLAAGQSDDAEAGVLGRVLKSDVAYNQLRKLVAKNKQNGISPVNTVQKWIHDKGNTTYDAMNKYAIKVDGARGGDYFKQESQSIMDQILDGVESPDKDLMSGLQEWAGVRGSRELGHTPSWEKGAASPGLLGATAATTAGALAAPALVKDGVFQHSATKEPVVERRAPVNNQSSLLEGVTNFADNVFTNFKDAAGPVGSLLMPFEGVNDYLKTVNDYDKQPTWRDRLGLLDL